MNDDSRLIVAQPRGQNVILAVIFVLVVIVVLIIVILRLRRTAASGTSTKGTGSTQCVNDVDCSGTQVCSSSRGICVDCVSDANCPVNSPVCDTSNDTCVGCLSNTGCPISKPNCDPVTKQCVQCVNSTSCGGASPHCNPATHICVGCLSPSDCDPSSPICDPGSNTCVECLSNVQCTSPATCNSGRCCDITPPTINSLTADITPPNNPHFGGSYTFSPGQAGATAVFEVSDPTGHVLLVTPGVPVDGTISIYQPQLCGSPKFYSGYNYQVRVRISQACGATAFSNYGFATMPYTPSGTIGVITNVGGNLGGFTITTSTPDSLTVFFYMAEVHIIPDAQYPSMDLNSAPVQTTTVPGTSGANGTISGFWPMPVASGQKYWFKITGSNTYDCITPSNGFPFVIP